MAAANARRAGTPGTGPVAAEANAAASAGTMTAPEGGLVEETPAVRPFASDLVLTFEFGKSRLTDDARRTLTGAIVTKPSARARWMSIALEGHADWTGTEDYNERLGLARAESVRQYLAEQLHLPVDQISVISYGETSPVAPNTTREGRARNRRVVIKAGN